MAPFQSWRMTASSRSSNWRPSLGRNNRSSGPFLRSIPPRRIVARNHGAQYPAGAAGAPVFISQVRRHDGEARLTKNSPRRCAGKGAGAHRPLDGSAHFRRQDSVGQALAWMRDRFAGCPRVGLRTLRRADCVLR